METVNDPHTGPEHYREGNRLLGLAREIENPERLVAAATAHFTAALAAATALSQHIDAAMPEPDWLAWRDAASMAAPVPAVPEEEPS